MRVWQKATLRSALLAYLSGSVRKNTYDITSCMCVTRIDFGFYTVPDPHLFISAQSDSSEELNTGQNRKGRHLSTSWTVNQDVISPPTGEVKSPKKV